MALGVSRPGRCAPRSTTTTRATSARSPRPSHGEIGTQIVVQSRTWSREYGCFTYLNRGPDLIASTTFVWIDDETAGQFKFCFAGSDTNSSTDYSAPGYTWQMSGYSYAAWCNTPTLHTSRVTGSSFGDVTIFGTFTQTVANNPYTSNSYSHPITP